VSEGGGGPEIGEPGFVIKNELSIGTMSPRHSAKTTRRKVIKKGQWNLSGKRCSLYKWRQRTSPRVTDSDQDFMSRPAKSYQERSGRGRQNRKGKEGERGTHFWKDSSWFTKRRKGERDVWADLIK